MELTIIGHWGGYPKVGEASSGYLLRYEDFHLLIDCGSAVLSHLQYFLKPTDLDAVIVSHYHPDHVADIGVLQHALLIDKYVNGTKKNIPIYGHTEDHEGFLSLTYKDITTGVAINTDEPFQVGPFEISVLKTVHPVPCYAMRISVDGKVIVYTADTEYFSELIPFCTEADLLLCETNYYKGMESYESHMTSSQAGKLAQQAKVKKLILTHLPQFGNIEQLILEAEEQYSGEIILAKKGLKVTI